MLGNLPGTDIYVRTCKRVCMCSMRLCSMPPSVFHTHTHTAGAEEAIPCRHRGWRDQNFPIRRQPYICEQGHFIVILNHPLMWRPPTTCHPPKRTNGNQDYFEDKVRKLFMQDETEKRTSVRFVHSHSILTQAVPAGPSPPGRF